MKTFKVWSASIVCFLFFEFGSSAVLDQYISKASPCESHCDGQYDSIDLKSACKKGCRLFTIIGLAKDLTNNNKTEDLCFSACQEAYTEAKILSENLACNNGCKNEAVLPSSVQDVPQTLHLLTPLMYVKSAYKTVIHHVRQLVTTSFTLYVEEDSGKMVVLQASPKASLDIQPYADSKSKPELRNYRTERSDWLDCISQQSKLPRWMLISMLFAFIIALLWLCCITTATAPPQFCNSNEKKLSMKNDVGYLYLYQPVDEVPIQPPPPYKASAQPDEVILT